MAERDGTVLIVDDDPDILTAGKLLLKRHYDRVVTCDTPARIEQLMAQHEFDAILLDAPCTATGVIRRHPEIKWLRTPAQVDEAVALQARLLKAVWPQRMKP